MGSRRTKQTVALKEKSEVSRTPNSSGPARNLSKNDLGAVIFGCKHHTYSECLLKKMFGLPAGHYSYVRNVKPGLTLFLFNYSDRKLHGIFEAVSPGQLNINPYAWITSEGTETTPYAAQVRVDVRRQCQPLHEEQFKPIIAENYYAQKVFWFELDKEQSRKLIKLFLSFPLPDKTIPRPPNTFKWNNMFDVLSDHDADESADNKIENCDPQECSQMGEMKLTEAEHSSALVVGSKTLTHVKKWSELFNDSSSLSGVNHKKGLEYDKAKFSTMMLNYSGVECEFASFHETSRLLPEACPEIVNTESDSTVLESWEDLQLCENEDTCLQVHIHGSRPDITNMPENTTCLDREVEGLKSSEFELVVESWEDLEPRMNEDHIQGSRPDLTNMPENTTCLDGEVGDLKSSEFEPVVVKMPGDAFIRNRENVRSINAMPPIENSHDHPKADMNLPENRNATSVQVLMDTQSADSESLFIKLMQEVEGLKVTQLQQKMKIEYLEQALVASKLEIHQLKSQYRELGKIPSYASGHLDLDDCNLPSFSMEETVLIAGGFDGYSWLPDLCSYSPSQDHVLPLCPMSFARSYTAPALLNGELYVLGGIHDNVCHDTVESYNPMSNQWVQRPSLNKAKASLAGASLYENIFAIGGGDGVECCSEVEVFDLNIGRWVYSQPMHEKRFAPAATEINGAIYVAGGYDERDYLRSVERFDPRERAWTRLGNMNTKRGCHSLVSFKEKLYALGGYDGDKMVSTVEAFDLRVGLWTIEEPMHTTRGYFGSFVFGGKIYVIGGVNDNQALDIVECYDEGSGWQVMDLTGIGKRCLFSSVVMVKKKM